MQEQFIESRALQRESRPSAQIAGDDQSCAEVDLGLWRAAGRPRSPCGLSTHGPRGSCPRMRAERHV
jgi:hypothetical protein